MACLLSNNQWGANPHTTNYTMINFQQNGQTMEKKFWTHPRNKVNTIKIKVISLEYNTIRREIMQGLDPIRKPNKIHTYPTQRQ